MNCSTSFLRTQLNRTKRKRNVVTYESPEGEESTKRGSVRKVHRLRSRSIRASKFARMRRGGHVYEASRLIEADKGGVIELGNPCAAGTARLVFMPGDLCLDTRIQCSWNAGGGANGMWGDIVLSPHGTVFKNPVSLELPYKAVDLAGVDEDNLAVFYYNESAGKWQRIGGNVDHDGKVVVTWIYHFSRYAIGAE